MVSKRLTPHKMIFLFAALFCCVTKGSAFFPEPTAAGNDSIVKKVVFIIVDGISADMLEKTETPFLDSIAHSGSKTEAYVGGKKGAYSETPTISAVGYNSLLTGTWANKHNVLGNQIKDPNYRYPSIFRILKDNHPDKKTAIFSTWLDNRTKLIGEGLPATGNIKMDYAFDGFELDTVNFPHDDQRRFIKDIDTKVADEAARFIKKEGPDLSWVYLEFSDDMGHKYGDSPQLYDAITFEDQLVGKIWQAVKERETSHQEEWMLVVTTDHGRSAVDGKDHGGQSERERSTWIVTNFKNTNTYFKEHIPAVVDIFPTIVRFMDLKVQEKVAYEIDGVPLIGTVDMTDLQAEKVGKDIQIAWKGIDDPGGTAEIYLSTTDKFAEGKKDKYRKIGKVAIDEESFTIPSMASSPFYKIVLKSPNTVLNTWITENKNQHN